MPGYLLDTHAVIWYIEGDQQLSQNAKSAIESMGSRNYVSIASLWEIAIKINLGKLKLKTEFNQILKKIEGNSFELLPISFEDTSLISRLPLLHRDPFDRILVAQAVNNKLTILTRDPHVSSYNVGTIW